jgi:hypothetical protein
MDFERSETTGRGCWKAFALFFRAGRENAEVGGQRLEVREEKVVSGAKRACRSVVRQEGNGQMSDAGC